MATEKQILANQRNAQLSTGPRTDEGRKNSRLNAYRHGLTAQIEVLTPEEKEVHDTFCDGLVASLKPADALESQLAHSIADGHWRLNRIRNIENNIFAAGSFDDDLYDNPEVNKALDAARIFAADPARFQLLTVYEMRIHRKTSNDLKQLKQTQAVRLALEAMEKAAAEVRRAQAWEEASLLIELALSEGESCDPDGTFTHPNGFVFSNAEIIGDIRYACRLQAARTQFNRSRNYTRLTRAA
jgi:hypothetical protein